MRPSFTGQATLGSSTINDVSLLLELDATTVDGLACSAELTPDLRLAIAQLGHHQLGVVVGATTSVLMMLHIEVPVGLSAVVALHCFILIIMRMHEIPLMLIIATGGWLEALLMVWATSCVAAGIAAMVLACTHWAHQLRTTVCADADLGGGPVDGAYAENGIVLRSVRTALFLLHPFETFALCVSGLTRLTAAPSFPACLLPLTQQSPKAARRVGVPGSGVQTVVASAHALMMVVLVIKLPGIVAKWSSSGGVYGPLQRAWLLGDGDASTLSDWAGRIGAATADSVTAAVFTSATRHMSGAPLRRSAESHLWMGVLARAVACSGVLCAGRDLYVLPWAVAVLLVVPVGFAGGGGPEGAKDV